MNDQKNTSSQIRLPIIVVLALVAGLLIGANVAGGSESDNNLLKSLYKFRQVLTYIDNDYVDKVNTEELVEKAISDLLVDLDPHSVYITGKELELTRSQLVGNYGGIGIEFNIFKDTLHVVSPFSGGPSDKAGLRAGDKIVKVDGENIAGINLKNSMVFDKLRGEKGSEVKVTVKRRNQKELLEYKIIRDLIPQYAVDVSYMIDEKTGYIKVNKFSATTFDEFKVHLTGLVENGMERLILDLTGNPGGYLDKAVKMADEMLAGDAMIVYTKGKGQRSNSEYTTSREGAFEKQPIIVLVDEGSASASEIVAGALQDHDRALIVGRRSFGKGLVQMPIELTDGSELRLTISRYYTPSGRSIQKPYEGKTPEYNRDILDRYESGEMFHKDSLKVNDSLKFSTTAGRIVYGGGGITPDFFVPVDTSMNSSYLNGLMTSNTLREYTLLYTNREKIKLEETALEDFIENFEVSDKMLKEMIKLGETNKLAFDKEGYERSKPLIKNYLKAQIARAIWDNEGFYPVLNETNEIYQSALKLFDEAEELAEKYN
ncbi:MAG: S41 family peptidase [Cyclobacteriaceae bacterium]